MTSCKLQVASHRLSCSPTMYASNRAAVNFAENADPFSKWDLPHGRCRCSFGFLKVKEREAAAIRMQAHARAGPRASASRRADPPLGLLWLNRRRNPPPERRSVWRNSVFWQVMLKEFRKARLSLRIGREYGNAPFQINCTGKHKRIHVCGVQTFPNEYSGRGFFRKVCFFGIA